MCVCYMMRYGNDICCFATASKKEDWRYLPPPLVENETNVKNMAEIRKATSVMYLPF